MIHPDRDRPAHPPSATPERRRRRTATALVALTAATALTAPTAAHAEYQSTLGYDPVTTKGSLFHIGAAVQAHDSFRAGFAGKGIGVALIDTGVTEVPGLHTGNVVHGPDLSFDSQDDELRHLDAYGHGTHLASIIVGRDAPQTTPGAYAQQKVFAGIAPDATLVSVKVGASDGAVDVSQVIAAVNWVVANKATHNIRVLNLSYGTDSVQDYQVDPLVFAVENAWRNGIVVVAAGGNDGRETMLLANPAMSPSILAIGGDDTQGTLSVGDDDTPLFASRGTDKRHVDVVAPAVSVLGLRVPGGYADERNPDARVGTRFAKASGTSQSAAVVSGAVALLLQENPKLTPDQVKTLLMSTARSLSPSKKYSGRGLVAVKDAQNKSVPSSKGSGMPWSSGLGSLEAARGSAHVSDVDGVELRGEIDIFGDAWEPATWATAVTDRTVWDAGRWRGVAWTGDGWEGRMWRGTTWSARAWSGRMWRDEQWAGRMWRAGSWTTSLDGWTGRMWRDAVWAGRMWRAANYASAGWV